MASLASQGPHQPQGQRASILPTLGYCSKLLQPLLSALNSGSTSLLSCSLPWAFPRSPPSPGAASTAFLPCPALGQPHLFSQAPVTFFDSTPTGRVLNRFSSDVACADDSLPFILNILLANAAGLLGLLAVLGFGLPWLLLLLPPLSVIYYRVQRHYRASSRELRRLGSLTLSPLYTHLADTLTGLPVLRAAGATYRCVSASSNRSHRREMLGWSAGMKGAGRRWGWAGSLGERGRKQKKQVSNAKKTPL